MFGEEFIELSVYALKHSNKKAYIHICNETDSFVNTFLYSPEALKKKVLDTFCTDKKCFMKINSIILILILLGLYNCSSQ